MVFTYGAERNRAKLSGRERRGGPRADGRERTEGRQKSLVYLVAYTGWVYECGLDLDAVGTDDIVDYVAARLASGLAAARWPARSRRCACCTVTS